MTDDSEYDMEVEAQAEGSDRSSEKTSLLDRIATELRRLHQAEATGELAALRRMRRYDVPPAAFYRLIARAGATEIGTDAVRRWARAVAMMAQRPDTLKASGLGETLKAIGFSEQRLDMLLYARGPALQDLALRTAVRIAKSDGPLPYRELCLLVLYGADPKTDNVRIRIAQSYLRATGGADDASASPTTASAT